MSPRNRMILCLVCLAAVGMFCVAGCTTTPPKTNATPNVTANATMNNTILKINNNQMPNFTPNASTTVAANKTPAGNVTIPIINATLPAVNLSNVTLPKLNSS
jgi:hypothetical protein